jgi:TPR repeat protein
MTHLNTSYYILLRLIIDFNIGGHKDELENFIRRSAEAHVPQAEHMLAVMYEYGHGVYQNFEKAAKYYQQAAEKHYSDSIYNLALMHAYGRGFPQDFKRAYPLLEKAAVDGHAQAMYYMVRRFKRSGCMSLAVKRSSNGISTAM